MSGSSKTSSDFYNYYKLIEDCAENKKDLIISNGLAEHAVYLMTAMFRYAKNHIRLFSGELPDEVRRESQTIKIYSNEELLMAAENFLRMEGSRLDILVQEGENFESRIFIQTLKKKHEEGVIKGSVNLKISEALCGISSHFMVIDNSGYRLETDHNHTKAVANFGDSNTARKLGEIFNTFFHNANEILSV